MFSVLGSLSRAHYHNIINIWRLEAGRGQCNRSALWAHQPTSLCWTNHSPVLGPVTSSQPIAAQHHEPIMPPSAGTRNMVTRTRGHWALDTG